MPSRADPVPKRGLRLQRLEEVTRAVRSLPARLQAARARARLRPLPPERRPWTAVRTLTLLVLVGLFIAGTILFTQLQEQRIFKDADYQLQEGLAPRPDGAIIFGATVISFAFTLLLGLFSSPRAPRRLLKLVVFFVALASLLVAHLSIFVNGVLFPGSGRAAFTASLLYHDSESLGLAALFLVTLFTAFVGTLGLLAAYAVLYPRSFSRNLGLRGAPGAPRRVAQVTWLGHAVPLLAFAALFFHSGLTVDQVPEQGFLTTNVILVFYLAAASLVLLALAGGIRNALALWARPGSGEGVVRAHGALVAIENWVLPLIFLFIGLVGLTPARSLALPVEGNLVFATNARGAAGFLLLLLFPYIANRRATRRLVAAVVTVPDETARQREIVHTLAQAATFLLLLPGLALSGGRPITVLATTVFVSGALFLLQALEVRVAAGSPRLALRDSGALPTLLAALLLLPLAGLMLWGVGNTVDAMYLQQGGFIVAGGSELQPFATLFKFLGAALIAVPLTLALALKVRGGPGKYGPLVVVPFTLIIGMVTYFSLTTESVPDPDRGLRDVRVGFAQIGLTVTDTVALTILWAVLAAGMLLSLAWLLERTRDLPSREPVTVRPAPGRA